MPTRRSQENGNSRVYSTGCSPPAACAPERCPGTRDRYKEVHLRECAALRCKAVYAPRDRFPVAPCRSVYPLADSSRSRGWRHWAETLPSETHTRKYPDLRFLQSSAAHTSERHHALRQRKTSQTRSCECRARFRPPAVVVA